MAFADGCSMRATACISRRTLRSMRSMLLLPRFLSMRLRRLAWSVSILRIWSLATGALPMSRAFALWHRKIKPLTPRSFRPISPPVTIACVSCSTPPTGAFTILLSTAPTAGRALPSSARCPMTERPRRWITFLCAPPAPQSMLTRSTGAFMRSPMPALSADRTLRGVRRIAAWCQRPSTQRRLSAPRARPAMRSSTAAPSCWPAAASSPSRAWADSTWHATPPTNKRCANCAVASVAATSRLPSWCAVLPTPSVCVISIVLSATCWLAVFVPLCCCTAVQPATTPMARPTPSSSLHLSRTTCPSLALCSPTPRFSICCSPQPRRAACAHLS